MRLTIRKTLKRSWLAALAVVGIGSTALAAPIEITNGSFETPDLSEGNTWSNDLSEAWTNPNDAGGSFVERIGGFSAESAQHVGTQDGAFIYQNTGVAVEPNTTYTLIVGVGSRNESFSPAGAMAVLGLTVLDGDATLSAATANEQVAADEILGMTAKLVASPTTLSSFEDRTITFTSGAEVPAGNVVVFLGDDASEGRSHFDNVRLYAQPAGTNIGPESEFQTASLANNTITLDGDLSEWNASPIVNARNRVGGDGAGELVPFEPFDGGTWDGPEDHSNVTYLTYDADNLYVGVVVTDDYHEHAAAAAWNGDAIQLHVANAARSENVALYNYALLGVDGALGDIVIQDEKAAGGGGTEVAIIRDGTTTTYEIKLPKAALGLDDLSPGVQLGIGMTINDGDEAEPGQKGWGGLGTHSIVYNGKTPGDSALVTLGAPFEQVWTVGLPGDGWPQDGTGGGAATVFVQEAAAANDLPGDPASPVADQQSDSDYYFAGVYDTVLDGGAYSPVGAVAENETGAERAFAGVNNTLRYHFNLPTGVGPGAPLAVSWSAENLDQREAEAPDSRYGVEVYFNGVLVGEETVVRPGQLRLINTTPSFTIDDVNGMAGEGFDNYVELRGVSYSEDGGGNWMGVDHVSLSAEAAPAEGFLVTSPSDPTVLVSGTNDDDADAGAPPAAEGVANATDGTTQKYLNFLDLGSGFIVTPAAPTSLNGARFYTANDVPERDPASYVIEGGDSADGPWTLIAEGDLDLPLERNAAGLPVTTDLNHQAVGFAASAEYASFRVTFPTLRDAGATNSMQIAEVELLGPQAPGVAGLNIAFVSFHETDAPSADAAAADPPLTEASDIGYTNLLTAQGHTVTRVLTGGGRDDADFLNGFDLIIISRAVNSGDYGDGANSEFWNTQITAPVMNLGGYTFRNSRLNWTDGATMVDTDGPVSLSVAVADHPVFAGVDLSGPYANLIEGERGISFNMDNVVGGTVLATAADTATAGGAAIFEFAKDAVANNGNVISGPRLAFLTGSRELDRTSQTAGFYDLTASGEAMFLNAVNYMGAGAGFEFPGPAASIAWDDVNPDTKAADLIGGSSITFEPGTFTASNGEGTFFTGDGGDTGNEELNAVYNSHGWTAAPGGTVILEGLTVGTEYQIQFLGAGDTRGCCNTRTQTADDGNGNVSGPFLRGNSSVVGTFTATGATQEILIGGETDPGLSGYILAAGGEVVLAVNIGRVEGDSITVSTEDVAPPIEEYLGSFDFADGTTDLGDGSIIASDNAAAPASVQGGVLRLTTAENGGGGASFILPAGFDGSGGWTMTFDFAVEHTGADTPADGFSINYGDLAAVPEANRFGNPAEEGYGDLAPHVSYQVDTWLWNDAAGQDAGVGVELTGIELGLNKAADDNANFKPNERVEAKATLTWDPERGASFVTEGLRVNADFIDLPTEGFTPDSSYGFSFLARTGGHNETVEIDNLVLVKGAANLGNPDPVDAALLKVHYEFEEGTGNVVKNLAPAPGGAAQPSPIAHWPLDEINAEGLSPDVAGSRHMTAVNLTADDVVEGAAGNAIAFDNARMTLLEYVGPEGEAIATSNPAYTISLWTKVKGTGQNDLRIFSEGSTTSGTPLFNLGTANNGDDDSLDLYLRTQDNGNPYNHARTTAMPLDDAWHHIAFTQEAGGQIAVYIDGVLDAIDTAVLLPEFGGGINTTSIGGIRRADPSHWVTGLVDDVKIFDVALTAEQIAVEIANPGAPDPNAAPAPGTVVADSIADWAGTADQGVNGWSYGYRGLEFAGPADYDPADFTAFDVADGWVWTGTQWDWGTGDVPWTAVAQEEGHPNTTINETNTTGADLHHAIRRWTSDIAGDVLITYSGREVNLSGGGVVVGVHVNGVLLDSTQIDGGDADGFTKTVEATLAVGDVVDCFLSPTDVDGTEADASDGSAWAMSIATAGAVKDGILVTTNADPWSALAEDVTTSVGGPGYLFFDDADGADATYVDTGLTPADLGIAEAPYTMMARVRQDVLGDGDSGDAMIFGQASGNVLHNGARGDQLHIGHWGSDLTGGSVSLGEWRHVAYVFNGTEEIIYVNGTEVAREGGKVGLTSEGRSTDTILIGTTRLDQDRDFQGCLDDVRIYCGALTEGQIEAIACESPNADCDGDGIADSVELALFGTLDRDGTGDFDGDRVNDATEIALGTNADNRDSDGDGLWDGAETLAWLTDPMNPDSDGDGLNDGDEVTLHGTDPNTDDTDRDGIADGDELVNGPSTTVLDFETDPGLEIINFSDEGIAPEVRAEGGNPGGYLSLTDAVNGARATVIFPDTTGGSDIAGFKFSVDARIGGGTDRPADGLSISLVRPDDPVLQDPRGSVFAGTIDLGADPGEESLPEEGSRTGVSVGFDAWESGGSDLVGFSVRVDGELLAQIPAGVLNGALDDPLSLQTGPQAAGDDNLANLGWARFEINLDADGTLDVTWKGSTLVDNVQTSWTPSPGQLVFAARTGGANQAHHFDNIELAVIPEGSADPLVFNEGAIAAGQKVYYEFDDFDALPSPEAASFIAADASAAGTPGLKGQYWALEPKAFESVGATSGLPLHRSGGGAEGEDNANAGFADSLMAANPVPSGTFVATDLNYTGDDLTPIVDWLGADGASYEGDTSETAILGDALMRFTGYLWVDAPGDRTFSTNSDDGSVIYINNEVAVHHDNGHGQNGEDPLPAPQLATINFPEAGFYPVDIRYFNGDWTDDAGAHGGANFATTGLDPANLFQSVEGAGANVVTNLGVGNDGTLVGASLADAASVALADPTMTWTEVGQIPSINGQFDGADLLDATFRAVIDFDAKTEGNAENIWESGGATIGTSFVYEAPSTLALRTVGLGGNAVLTAKAPLSEADLAGGPLEVIWTIDVNPSGPEVGSIWINGEPRVSVSFEKGNDWSGGDAMNILSGTPNLSAGGGNSNLPGGSSAFASGTVDLTVGIQFFRDTLFTKGILNLNGDGTVYVDTNHTAAETGASTENYTMLARIQANDLSGDNMVFGQASGNVLHNGLRDANFHQGHWGNDTNGGTAEVGQWYNVAWRYTAGTQTIFVDGEPVVAGSAKGLLGEMGNILVGATRLDEDRSFNGQIDYAQIYCRALSHEAIKSIQGKSLDLDSDLLVHYEFEQGISMTVQNTGNSGAPDGSLNSLDVISAYASGSPSPGGPGVMSFDTTGGTDATYIDTGLTGTEAGINGAVNYTMMAWIKPTNDAAGDQMFFGQGEGNVLHNGIRDRRLHIGHWGNDLGSGASPVTYNQWQHVAFTYDGAAMTQSIYINGELTETAGEKGALNNDGNLLIGTTRFNEDRDYTGLLDDVRVYGSVLNGSQIASIAGIGDTDGDGVDDAFERAFFGNLAMNGSGDPDGDGITNADEERLGLDPTVSDAQFSDADGDGWTLGDETDFGTNPNNGNNFPEVFVGGGQWEVRVVQAEGTVVGLAGADALLSGEAPNISDVTSFHDFINFGAGAQGSVGGDVAFPDGAAENFAIHAKADIEVITTGEYTLSFSTDDGMRIIVDGEVLAEVDGGRGAPALDPYTITLTAGRHSVELVQYEQTGGDAAEFAGTINTDNSLNGLGGGTVVLIPAAGEVDPNAPPQGLLAYWDFNGEGDPVDIVSGAVATLTGGAEYGEGPGGAGDGAIDFGLTSDGQTLAIEDPSILAPIAATDAFTVSFWQNQHAIVNSSSFWVDAVAAGDRALQSHTPWSNGEVYLDTAGCCNADQRINALAEIPVGTWQHFTFVKDGPFKAIYIDGVEFLTGDGAAPIPEGVLSFNIGSANGGANSMQGLIDEFSIWSVALSPADIEALAAGAKAWDPSVTATSPLADGLIGYWPFDGDLEDKAGTSHGTAVGEAAIEFADGQFGQGIDLNGAQHVTTPVENEEMFDFPEGNFSVSAWFRVDNFDKGWQALVTKGEGSNWRIHRRAETDHLGPVAGPQDGNATAGADMVDGPDVNDGAIHHVIITNGPDGSNYYLDGVLAGTAPAGGTQGNEWPMMIGENADLGGRGRQWDGLIDEVAVWNRQLSEEEVLLIVNGASIGEQIAAGGDGGVAGLLGYWPDEYVSTAADHMDLGTLPVLTLESDFAWSFWVNAEVTDNNNTVLGNRYMSDGADFDPREFIKFTPRAFEWHFNGGGENVSNAETMFPVGEWVHNLVVKEGTTLTYYRNGAAIASGAITGAPINAQPLYLGGVPGPDGATLEGFAGTFMEVATFDRALSADDVADVYNRGLNGESLSGGAADPRASAVAQSSGPLSTPTLVDFGALEGDTSYEFSFNAVKAGASTALAGNLSWGLKLDQWQDSGFFGTTEFGVADNLSDVPTVFGEDTHVVFSSDTTAGSTSIYVNGALAGTVTGNPLLAGEVTVMGATRDPDPIDVFGEGSVMHGWATYNSALSAEEVAALAAAPFAGGESGPDPLNIVFVSFHDSDAPSVAAESAGFTEAPDKGYTDLLTANGHTVTRWATRDDPTADDAAALNSFDLVVISRSVSSGQYQQEAEFWNTMVTVPVMNLGGYTYRNSRLNWTDGGDMVDADGPITLTVADTDHPIFSGVDVSGPYANGLLEGQRGLSFNNNMVVGGTLLASAADTSVAGAPAIFEFAAGATVNNGNVLAAPRLAFLTGSREGDGISSETSGIYDLTASGEQMFLNAVNYIGSGTGAAQVTSVKELVDSDHDGVANVLEAIAGTDANNPSDYFHISSIKPSGAGLMISFDGVEGLAYDIEFSENLSEGSWQVIGSQTTGETTAIEFLHEERPAGQGFYRARVVQD